MKRLTAPGLVALVSIVVTYDVFAAHVDMRLIDEIKIGGSGGWDYATIDQKRHVLYLSHNSAVAAVDLGSRRVTAHLADADGVHVALPVPGGDKLLITHGKANQITLNDARTGSIQATIATDVGPDAAVIDPGTGYAFVMANHGGMVDVIDLTKNVVIQKIVMNGAPEGAAADGRGHVFTHLEDKDSVSVIDAATARVAALYAMNDCKEPSGIAFDSASDLILSACKNGIARLTDAATGAEVATLPIGERPDFALVDHRRHLAFIPCGDGTLTVIHLEGKKSKVIQVVKTGVGARTAALDEDTGRLYLPTASLTPPAAPGERPGIVPETFKVLVVGEPGPARP